MKTALITSTGAVAADIVVKSLKRMGCRTIGCNIYPREWVVESCEVDSFHQIPPISESIAYFEAVKDICLTEKVDYVLPMIDYEIDIFNEHRDWFERNAVCLCISPKSAIDIVRNKKALEDFVVGCCPETKAIPTENLDDVEQLPWKFPVVCKPANGRSSQGLRYIHNEAEWKACRESARGLGYVVEPFIAGPIVMVEVVRQAATGRAAAMVRRELTSTPNGCSTAAYVYHDEALAESARKLAERLGVEGDVNFEYIQDSAGLYHLVECNPRFSAGCEFACIGGYDCVENHMKCFTDETIEEYHFKHPMIISRKYEEYVTSSGRTVDYVNRTYH